MIQITSFFRSFFNQTRTSIFRKCLRCDEFLTTSDFKIKHDFLNHYDGGNNDVFEDKPVDIEKASSLLKYEITVNKHREITTSKILRKLLIIF